MKTKGYFSYKRDERIGLLLLVFFMVVVQFIYSYVDFSSVTKPSKEELDWLSLQTEIDSLKQNNKVKEYRIYPFNPNFLTDFKGYKLGMSVAQIDRLFAYRKMGKFVNSPEEFQSVTKVSDELLEKISPYFKFPEWVKYKKYK